jgi:hypothetical protein
MGMGEGAPECCDGAPVVGRRGIADAEDEEEEEEEEEEEDASPGVVGEFNGICEPYWCGLGVGLGLVKDVCG